MADALHLAVIITSLHPVTVLGAIAVAVAVLACFLAHVERRRALCHASDAARDNVARRRAETERDEAISTVAWMASNLATSSEHPESEGAG